MVAQRASLAAAIVIVLGAALGAEEASYRLVPEWAKLPAGYVFGHPISFPLPAERDRVRAEAERERALALARGKPLPPREPELQPGVSGVAVDLEDNVYVFHRGEHPVLVFDSRGNFLRTGADGITGTVPHFIKVDREGFVWVVDEAAHRVLKLDREMKRVVLEIGTKDVPGYDPTHLDRPADVAITSTGEILVADGYGNNRIAKFSSEGKFLKEWGGGPDEPSAEAGKFHLPHAVVVDPNDAVYVLDRENRRIQKFDSEGRLLGIWTHLGYAWGMALSRDGKHLFVAEHDQEQVLRVETEDGRILERWGSQGRGPGQFDWAHGIAVDSRSAVYVGDTYGQRVQKFEPGKLQVEGTVGCLEQVEGRFFLTAATDPVPGDEVDRRLDPVVKGERRYEVIGTVEEFGVPDHTGHRVRLKGLLVEAEPFPRLQITSLRHLASRCP
jgi:DNA-binding beta-propeller fold protein YncE